MPCAGVSPFAWSHASATAKVILPELMTDGFTATGSIATTPAVVRLLPGGRVIVLASVTMRSVEPSDLDGTMETETIA